MENIAQLGIKVDSTSIKQATNELSKLTAQSGKTDKSTNALKTGFVNLKNAVIGYASIQTARQIIDTADSMNLLNARLKLATASTAEYTSQQTALLNIAKQSFTSFSDTLTLFTKLNPALKQVGATTEQVNSVVASFNKGLQLGGSTAEEASSAILQFSQAMATGILRGEEFNAINEASPKLMSYLAKGLGVAQGELRKMAENGELTAGRVSNALLKVKSDIDRDFSTLPITVGKAITNLKTELSVAIDEINTTTGATESLAKSIQTTTVNIGLFTKDVLDYYREVKNFFDENKMLADAIGASFDFLGKAGKTSLTIAALDSLNNTFGDTKLAADGIIKSLDELEKRKANLAQNKWTESNKKAIENQIADLKNQLSKINEKTIFTSSDVIPKNKTAIDNLVGDYEGASNTIDEINTKVVRNESELTKLIGDERAKFNLGLEESIKKAREKGATEAEINKFRADQLKEFNEKQNKSLDKQNKKLEETQKARAEIAQIGMSSYDKSISDITAKTIEWVKAGVSKNEVLSAEIKLRNELNIQQALSSASDELSFLERKAQLMTDEYEKSKLLLEIKYAQSMIDIQSSDAPLEQKQMMIEKETELYNLTKERIELDRSTEFQDTIKTFQEDALERQIALNESMYEFGDSFDGVAKNVSAASKAIINMNTISIKGKKEEDKLNEKYTKSFNKYAGDVEKTKELAQQYDIDSAQIKEQNFNAEIAGYANLAGAMASAFEKGSDGALAFTTLQATLGIVSSWTAIAQSWALPFPANIPAVAMVASAVMPIIGQLSAMGGSGGGAASSSGSKKPSRFELKEQEIEDMYTPMTDRLDRQIELLESIDKQGSASAVGLAGAKISFEKDYALAVNEIMKNLPNDRKGFELGFNNELAPIEAALGFNIADVIKIKKSGWDKSEKRIYTDFGSLNSGNNMVKLISAYFEDTSKNGAIAAFFGGHNALNLAVNKIQETIGNFTSGIVDSLDNMKDASSEFKNIYDEITGSMYYENKRLAQAYIDVEKLTKGTSLAEYLKNNIDQIDFLQQTFNNSVLETLLSQDPKDMAKQIKVLDDLQAQTGLVFENGAKEALDFMESIKLVGEAMSNTMENRKSLIDNLKDFVESINSTIDKPTTFKDFSSSFNEMIDAIKLGGDNLEELGNNAINSAQSYLDTVARTAKSSAEIEFAKKVISNKFEGVINAKDITLGTINDTLKISFNEDSVIVKAINDVKNELVYLNQLNTRQTANSNKTLQLQRASIA